MPTPPETPVSVAELSEVFNLGGTLARIETTLNHVATTGEKTNGTVTGMQEIMGTVQVQLAQHTTILGNLVPRVDKLEAADKVGVDAPSRQEFTELRDEVRSHRLSWPKIATLIGALVALFALVAIIDGWTPAS